MPVAVNVPDDRIVVGRGEEVDVSVVVVGGQLLGDEFKGQRVLGDVLIDGDAGQSVGEDVGLAVLVVVLEDGPVVQFGEPVYVLRGELVTAVFLKKG